MKYKNYFKVGDKLEIQVSDDYIDKDKSLISQLLEIASEDEYFIAIPIHEGNLVPISIGSKILVYYSVDNKGIFYFTAKLMNRKKNRVPYFMIKQLTETKTIQRRNYFRLDVSIPVEIYNNENETITTGYTKDLSGGGLKLISDKKLEDNENVLCRITIEGKELEMKVQVIRTKIYEKNIKQFEIGIKFLEIEEKDRNYIVGYLFKQQRILRQKGLI
ncbi:flagellar brake protein [Tepidibacter formicigenes]|jgi:c-di-GMP-binding flagellar brake protein YcgR|uniref:C-di-GMP-binding flagellar brake protein YcgR, contains PilZNR and PilZ domains n=1 Tax=Tepidibacter formicigenes DSM 15518 TaxID=1123349 RepID=A0A1M6JAV8_9FIRM|nr:flagellar brake protein [Tepidibacter formicigenes]SHJ43790.1 c-di-GMP-binding flagellar brake protein YcgR, contains PilZNR and PilZ domains [Tepidibacter formicigenes DSM 15518]